MTADGLILYCRKRLKSGFCQEISRENGFRGTILGLRFQINTYVDAFGYGDASRKN